MARYSDHRQGTAPSSARPQHPGHYADGGHHGRGRVIALVIVAVVLVIAVACAALGVRLMTSARTLQGQVGMLTSEVQGILSQAQAGQYDAALTELQARRQGISDAVDDMNEELHAAEWSVASRLPAIGQDVRAAQALASAADVLVDGVLDPAATLAQAHPLSSLVSDGAIDGEALQAWCDFVGQLAPSIERASDVVQGVSAPHVAQLENGLAKVRDGLTRANETIATYAPYAAVLPDMLGCNGRRSYLVVAQNNAEVRATGGMPGAMMAISLENGRLTMGDIMTAGDFIDASSGEADPFPLSEDEALTFGPSAGVVIQNTTYLPSFPHVANLLNQYWARDHGVTFDGVIAVDPFVLQALVAALGDVEMSDGTVLTGTTTAQTILHDVYNNYAEDPTLTDAYFVEAADAIISRLHSFNADDVKNSGLLGSLRKLADSGHILAWMANSDEEAAVTSVGIDGEVSTDPSRPTLGIYFNDATWSKFDWYLDSTTDIGAPVDNGDGTVTYSCVTRVANTATAEEALTDADYITGYNPEKHDVGDMLTYLYILAPAGGTLTMGDTSMFEDYYFGQVYGDQVARGMLHLEPGQPLTVTYDITVATGSAPLEIQTTPLSTH